MILRKPYALLIKNFKKIHLMMLFFMGFIAYSSNNILKFFHRLISQGTFSRSSFSLSASYINIYLIISTIIVIAISVVIHILMHQKKKPRLFYVIMISYYVILIVYLFFMYNTFDTLEISSISPQGLRIIRDITTIITYVQYGLLLLVAVRTFGFDIKKFNFGEDLQELEIEAKDNEEFELTVGIDRDKINRGVRRSRREIKYFFIENMFIMTFIMATSLILIVVSLFLHFGVYNKIYSKNQSFPAGYFVMSLDDAYYTTTNHRGESIAPKDKTYAVLLINLTNKDTISHQINFNNINITVDGKIFSPKINRYMSFIDFGEGYNGQEIGAGATKKYFFVFEMDESVNFNKAIFRYRESLIINAKEITGKYKRVKINGEHLKNDFKTINTAHLNEDLKFNNSLLKGTTLKINEVAIDDRFTYSATYCYNKVCTDYENLLTLGYASTGKTIMKINFDYDKDPQSSLRNSDSFKELIKNYGSIRYQIGGKQYNGEMTDIQLSEYRGKDLYYQVSSNLKKASTFELVIRIRNKEYIYKLK